MLVKLSRLSTFDRHMYVTSGDMRHRYNTRHKLLGKFIKSSVPVQISTQVSIVHRFSKHVRHLCEDTAVTRIRDRKKLLHFELNMRLCLLN